MCWLADDTGSTMSQNIQSIDLSIVVFGGVTVMFTEGVDTESTMSQNRQSIDLSLVVFGGMTGQGVDSVGVQQESLISA